MKKLMIILMMFAFFSCYEQKEEFEFKDYPKTNEIVNGILINKINIVDVKEANYSNVSLLLDITPVNSDCYIQIRAVYAGTDKDYLFSKDAEIFYNQPFYLKQSFKAYPDQFNNCINIDIKTDEFGQWTTIRRINLLVKDNN